MKLTLFLATSVDGFIAKSDDSVSWSQDVWDNYGAFCSEVGNLIVGRKTFEAMKPGGDFEKLTLKNLVIISHQKSSDTSFDAVWMRSPREAVVYLEKKNCTHAIVGGGRAIAHAFLTENLLTDIQLDVEPTLYGSGIPLIGELPTERKLELLEVRKSGAQTVRLHFRLG